MQSLGDKIGDDVANTIGTGVSPQGENLKLLSNEMSPTRVSIMAKRSAIQWRGPPPNGNHAIVWRFFISSGENLSGSYLSGSG